MAHKLIGCRDYTGRIPLPAGSRLSKSGRLPNGTAQHAYRHADTDTWYQVTAIRPGVWRVCEYVGADCPCAGGA